MREFDITKETVMLPFTKELMQICDTFSCGESDLDEFFLNDSFYYNEEMLGKTYCYVTVKKPYTIVSLFTLANDSIKTTHYDKSTKNRLNRSIPNSKRGKSYPATLIGRLGVNVNYQGKGFHIGTQVLDMLKTWFRDDDNKTGCRFLVVDAYNSQRTLRFYENNGFKFLHKDENEERLYNHFSSDEPLHTRLMRYDLKQR